MASLPYPRRPLKSSHRIHGIHRSFWRRRASHRFHRCSQMVRLRRVLPRNSQKLLVEKSLPQMCTDAHRWLGCVGFCGKIVWLLRGYGRMPYPPNLCPSVQSVGEYLASETSVGSVASVGDCLVSAWVWQGCHTFLICAHPCNLWENILHQKLLWFLWFLWKDSLVSAWVWQDAIPS